MVGSRLLIEQLAGPNIEGWDCTSLSSSLVHELLNNIHPINRFHECFIHRHIDMNSPVSLNNSARTIIGMMIPRTSTFWWLTNQQNNDWNDWILTNHSSNHDWWFGCFELYGFTSKKKTNHQLPGCLLRPRPAKRFRAGTRGWDVPRLRWGWVQDGSYKHRDFSDWWLGNSRKWWF